MSAAACLPQLARAATTGRLPYLQRLLADRVSMLWTMPQAGTGIVTVTDPGGTVTTFTAVNQMFEPADTALPVVKVDVNGVTELPLASVKLFTFTVYVVVACSALVGTKLIC